MLIQRAYFTANICFIYVYKIYVIFSQIYSMLTILLNFDVKLQIGFTIS